MKFNKLHHGCATTLLIVFGVFSATSAADDNWPQFRGPGGRGVAASANIPDKWSDSENVAWKTDIPGPRLVLAHRLGQPRVSHYRRGPRRSRTAQKRLLHGLSRQGFGGQRNPVESDLPGPLYRQHLMEQNRASRSRRPSRSTKKTPSPPKLPRPTASGCMPTLATWACSASISPAMSFGPI